MPGEKQSGFMRAVHTDVAMPARNLAPGNVALVLSPPRTRSLPGAFFAPKVARVLGDPASVSTLLARIIHKP